ncbi:MAG: hypothetical protein VKO39_06070 [Cyanobacteriota bacterium]|nr:hypothetical protein [Cyanobacteriota bacterium]
MPPPCPPSRRRAGQGGGVGQASARSGQEPGFLMPLATGAAGLLLLLGLTLQAMALQERAQVSAQERLQRENDLLVSAAHQLLTALNRSHGCLLVLPLERWETDGAVCATPQALAALRRAEVWRVPVRLLGWRPATDGLSADLELVLEAGDSRAARRGRFAAQLTGDPPQAVDLRARVPGGSLP